MGTVLSRDGSHIGWVFSDFLDFFALAAAWQAQVVLLRRCWVPDSTSQSQLADGDTRQSEMEHPTETASPVVFLCHSSSLTCKMLKALKSAGTGEQRRASTRTVRPKAWHSGLQGQRKRGDVGQQKSTRLPQPLQILPPSYLGGLAFQHHVTRLHRGAAAQLHHSSQI